MLPKIVLDQLEIFNAFEGDYIKFGNSFCTDAVESLNFIEFLRKKNLIILGIDTFNVFIEESIKLQPNSDEDIHNSKKYKKLPDGNYHWDVAKQFISDKRKKHLIFDIDWTPYIP